MALQQLKAALHVIPTKNLKSVTSCVPTFSGFENKFLIFSV
jgi:hypothetical protein